MQWRDSLILVHNTRGQITEYTFLLSTALCRKILSKIYNKRWVWYPYTVVTLTHASAYGLAGMYDILTTCAGNGTCACVGVKVMYKEEKS